MSQRRPALPRAQTIPWPTPARLEQAGFKRCSHAGCTTYVDPVNVPELTCREHQRRGRRAAEGPAK